MKKHFILAWSICASTLIAITYLMSDEGWGYTQMIIAFFFDACFAMLLGLISLYCVGYLRGDVKTSCRRSPGEILGYLETVSFKTLNDPDKVANSLVKYFSFQQTRLFCECVFVGASPNRKTITHDEFVSWLMGKE